MRIRRRSPGSPKSPRSHRTFFGYAWPSSRDRYVRECEQYEADKAACAAWEEAGKEYAKQRRELSGHIGPAKDILDSSREYQYSPLRLEASECARDADPERWDKLQRDISAAQERERERDLSRDRGRGGLER